MRFLQALGVLSLAFPMLLRAQVPVPFASDDQRFMVFANGRFEKLEPRPPQRMVAQEGRVVYVPHEGGLKVFHAEGRRLFALSKVPVGELAASTGRVAWTVGDTLFTVGDGKARMIATGVVRFSVADSLIAYHDGNRGELMVWWRGGYHPVAMVERATDAPQWAVGSNTVTFFDRSVHRLFLFHRGQVQLLADSTDLALVTQGEDLVGYWDARTMQWKVRDGEDTEVLSDLRPITARAGRRILAFVDGTGRLKCYANGTVHALTDSIPTDYWVHENMLLYLQGDHLMLFRPEGVQRVERYTPERWQMMGDRLVYLNINRELWGIEGGERVRYGREAAIPTFDAYGDAVVYPSPTGLTTVVRKGRSHLFGP